MVNPRGVATPFFPLWAHQIGLVQEALDPCCIQITTLASGSQEESRHANGHRRLPKYRPDRGFQKRPHSVNERAAARYLRLLNSKRIGNDSFDKKR